MNPQKATPENLGIEDCARLLQLIAQARVPLHEAPEWLVIAQKLGWEPPEETLDSMAKLMRAAYADGWRPDARY